MVLDVVETKDEVTVLRKLKFRPCCWWKNPFQIKVSLKRETSSTSIIYFFGFWIFTSRLWSWTGSVASTRGPRRQTKANLDIPQRKPEGGRGSAYGSLVTLSSEPFNGASVRHVVLFGRRTLSSEFYFLWETEKTKTIADLLAKPKC